MISIQFNQYQYQLKDKLGGGAFAKVYKCIRTIDNEIFAVKVLSKQQFKGSQGKYLKVAFEREVSVQKIATRSGIPFFVLLIDNFEDNENIYLVMELCDGNLLEYTGNKILSEEIALEFILQIGIGLNYLHSNQISHRDIKMENVMMKKGILKIADFGFASQQKNLETNLGTPTFMAPEFFDDSIKTYSPKIDVWALNTCLYYFLTNKLYFFANHPAELRKQVLTKPFEINQLTNNLKETTKDLLIRGYKKDPNQRLSMQQYIDHSSFAFLRSKYQVFYDRTKIAYANVDIRSIQIAEAEGDNQDYLKYFLNFRNNSMLYYKMSRELNEIGFNNSFCFLLLKRALQNVSMMCLCLTKKTKPRFRNFKDIKFEDKEWLKFSNGHWFKYISALYIKDFKDLSFRYTAYYKNLLSKSGSSEELPSFDLNIDEGALLTYFCNEIVNKINDIKAISSQVDSQNLLKFARRILIFEKYSIDQMVTAFITIKSSF